MLGLSVGIATGPTVAAPASATAPASGPASAPLASTAPTPPPAPEVRLALDVSEFEPRSMRVRLEGWYLDATPGRRVATVAVSSGTRTFRWPTSIIRRPDVVQATGRADAFESGWSASGVWPADDVPPESLSLTFLADDGAVLYEARGITPTARNERGVPFFHHAVAAGTVAVLLALLASRAVRRRPASP
ncbi:MAG: hypothetical protein ACRC2H_08950, partial [Silanimonas sp.]